MLSMMACDEYGDDADVDDDDGDDDDDDGRCAGVSAVCNSEQTVA